MKRSFTVRPRLRSPLCLPKRHNAPKSSPTFIAVLELVRQQFVLIMQNDVFDEIEIIARKNIAEKEIEYGEEDSPQGETDDEHSTGA